MGDGGRKSWRRNERFRRWPESKAGEFPAIPYPENSRFSIKQIAYLHAYCQIEPRDIVARYPRTISLAQVHLALSHYFTNKEPIDAEIAADLSWDRRRSLDDGSMTLPRVGPSSVVETGKNDAS